MPKPATTSGVGSLSVQRVPAQVQYSLTPGASTGKTSHGSVTGDCEHLRAAFRRGDAMLALDDGRILPIRVIAHTEGGDTAYFEA
jgi:hypothetical protein